MGYSNSSRLLQKLSSLCPSILHHYDSETSVIIDCCSVVIDGCSVIIDSCSVVTDGCSVVIYSCSVVIDGYHSVLKV